MHTPKKNQPTEGLFSDYSQGQFFCEFMSRMPSDQPQLQTLFHKLDSLNGAELQKRVEEMYQVLHQQGITFTLYSGNDATDRVLPFDMIPRIIAAQEWQRLEAGVLQRVRTLNMFLHDIYHGQRILKDNVLPPQLVLGNSYYRKEMQGIDVPGGVYVHICGVDLIRDEKGVFRVLEDNARTPSGVSYVVNNRRTMLRLFPDLMSFIDLQTVEEYGQNLRVALSEVAPSGTDHPRIVLLSPGMYNSAYFEHVFLAQEMGVTLVEGRDLVVNNDTVYMRTTSGLARVDVIYRRIDDHFLDPEIFHPESLLGVPGIMRAYRKGRVTIANAIGTGVADDKAVYSYMPRIIKYYLGEEPLLPNVETFICAEKEALEYTLDNIETLVVKPVGESGGYGMIIGPAASKEQCEEFRQKLLADPANYISQPVIKLSVAPTLIEKHLEARHVDLRPFAITGAKSWVLPGGLTRVALERGSLVVNSSQGGGSKDTWVLRYE
jgi:uncharacterized circularly permuted ATP-grasp superfamily protein